MSFAENGKQRQIMALFRPLLGLLLLFIAADARAGSLQWPVNCVPGSLDVNCTLGYPDVNNDGRAFNCGSPGYAGHQGTDISLNGGWTAMDQGVNVYAAAPGTVWFVSDGKYDRCPSSHPDCSASNYTVCTATQPNGMYYCFAGGNVVVILHNGIPGVYATRYDHLKNGSITVSVGQTVQAGQIIAQVGSAGHSTGPHLHFEVWGTGLYDLVEPWMGACGPNTTASLWENPTVPWGSIPTPTLGEWGAILLIIGYIVSYLRRGRSAAGTEGG